MIPFLYAAWQKIQERPLDYVVLAVLALMAVLCTVYAIRSHNNQAISQPSIGGSEQEVEHLHLSTSTPAPIPCTDIWLHGLAQDQAFDIGWWVRVHDFVFQLHELQREDPYVEFRLCAENSSAYDVVLNDMDGWIYFEGRMLSGTKQLRPEGKPEITPGANGALIVRQALTKDDATYILKSVEGAASFDFSGLRIMIKGAPPFENVVKPQAVDFFNRSLTNEHLLQAYGIISPTPNVEALTASIAELEVAAVKDKAALTTERLRGHILQALSVLYGKGTGLVNHLFYGTISQDEARYLIETWRDRLDTAIGDWLGASPLRGFRDGLLPLPESLEEQREWIKHTNGNLDKMIQGILNGDSIEMKRIKVRSALKLNPDGGAPTALWERHRVHPDGEVFIYGPTVVEVAETVKVAEAIQGGRLTVVD